MKIYVLKELSVAERIQYHTSPKARQSNPSPNQSRPRWQVPRQCVVPILNVHATTKSMHSPAVQRRALKQHKCLETIQLPLRWKPCFKLYFVYSLCLIITFGHNGNISIYIFFFFYLLSFFLPSLLLNFTPHFQISYSCL